MISRFSIQLRSNYFSIQLWLESFFQSDELNKIQFISTSNSQRFTITNIQNIGPIEKSVRTYCGSVA